MKPMDPESMSVSVNRLRLTTNDFSVVLCNNLFKCFQTGRFCDVTLLADDGKRIPAHRNVLYFATEYFKVMLTSGWKESGQTEIPIKSVDGDALQLLVQYCYTGCIFIDGQNVDEMTKASTMLQFADVQQKCADYYLTILSFSNCLVIGEIADLHNMERVKTIARAFAVIGFMEVSKCDEFLRLDAKRLSVLLKEDKLKVAAEENIFNALMRWVEYDVESRKQSLETLLECVRFQHIEEAFILDDVYHRQCLGIGFPEIFSKMVARRSSTNRSEFPRPPKFQFCLFRSDEIDRYCPHRNIWIKFLDINLDMYNFAVINHNGKMILIGGCHYGGQITNAVKSIDLATDEIVDMPRMMTPRWIMSAQLINNSIYVFGGYNNSQLVRSVERFDFARNEWTEVTPMSFPRARVAHVVTWRLLFVIGGWFDTELVNTVEYYDPAIDKWETVAPMLSARAQAAAHALNEFIYVLGGADEKRVLQSIERYNVGENSWTKLKFSLCWPGYWRSAAVGAGDWMYLAGGRDKSHADCNTFAKFNVITGKVIKLKNLRETSDQCCLIKL